MKKAIKDSKWYWWIPIVYVFYMFEMSVWVFDDSKSIKERQYRQLLTQLLMFPSIFIIIGIINFILKFNK